MKEITASLEDYLKAIYQILQEHPVARVKEISHRLQVTNASVVGALRHLREQGLVEQEPYGYIHLTEQGEKIAREISSRHQALKEFFQEVLELGEEVADGDACRTEHSLSPETIERIIILGEFFKSHPSAQKELSRRLEKVKKTGKDKK